VSVVLDIMSDLADLVRHVSYEVMPFRGTEENVVSHVPTSVPLTVTVTESKGIDATLDLAVRLHRQSYRVAPHLAARLFTGGGHVKDAVTRLSDAGIQSVFVVGGDAPRPAGAFPDAFSLLQAMEAMGHPFTDVGIAGYPEGHGSIPRETVDLALKQKAPLATRVLTQICFDAPTTARWAAGIAGDGIELPVHVGLPGPVNRQKLVRISANLGLGQSARFISKQSAFFWRLLLPRGYQPSRFVRGLGTAAASVPSNITGLHIFTFNELHRTEWWRQRLLAAVAEWSEEDGQP
jgi:methylenetetrahydrofolate reductase (NADPH)